MKHKIQIEILVPVLQRMMIGSGFSDSTINRKSMRNSSGEPFIPGSSLKGIIRNECEKLVNLYNLPVISPHNADTLDNFRSSSEHEYFIDRLFGSRFEGEKLFFSDANPCEKTYHITETISRNSIDRLMGTSKEGHLFTTEYIRNISSEGDFINYRAEIKGYHSFLTENELGEDRTPLEYCFLVMAILSCRKVGGDKSTGAGWLKDGIDIMSISYNGKDFSKDEFLKEFLSYGFEDIKELVDLYRESNS